MAQVGLYLDADQLDSVLSGAEDDNLRELSAGLMKVNRPVFLRIGYEFNNRERGFDAQAFRRAFRYVAITIRRMRADNVATVWHAVSPVSPVATSRDYMDYYPGDDVVDWWGISLFFEFEFRHKGTVAFYNAAKRHRKPILIGECSPWFLEESQQRVRPPKSARESLNWYRSFFNLLQEYPQIKGMNLIVVDWQRWNWIWPEVRDGFPNARLDRWPGLRVEYIKWISSDHFIHAGEAERLLKDARGD